MGKNKRQTRSSGKTNNKNNSPSRAHKRKQRRRKNELKAATYSAENTPESITVRSLSTIKVLDVPADKNSSMPQK
jgi:ribosomal protein L25 (general stress protein Ctc)